jgi:hypothetical protein
MRRASLLLIPMALAACEVEPAGPAAPIAREQVAEAPALDASASRQAVVDFVSAYAASPTEGVEALSQVVAGPELVSWVRWLDVQHREFVGTVRATADVRDVEFVGAIEAQMATGAQVGLSASVLFSFTPENAEPFELGRILDGSVALIRTEVGTYKVIDLQRDGVRMSEGIQLFRGESRSEGGANVVLDSLFMFPPNWQFNVLISNPGPQPLFLDPETVGLYVAVTDGFERLEPVLTPSLTVVPPGTDVAGILAFPMQSSATGRVLTLGYREGRGRGDVLRFDFPLDDLLNVVPPPPPAVEEPVTDVTT